jgi:TPP-dependent pyruvate/acetoin dehydrogenase alpha subunit
LMADDGRDPLEPINLEPVPGALLKRLFFMMIKIRLVEEEIARLVEAGKIICPCHLYIGQEAVASGVCAALAENDHVYSTHRSHGHYLAKGGELKPMMAEIFGRATGCSRGNGGSMHLVAPEVGFMGSSAIVGGSVPLAVGSALSFSLGNTERVSVSFFGDGAATEGVLYEALNFAALRSLPVIFVCENNLYSTHMHISAIQSNVELFRKAEDFNVASFRIDGNDVGKVYQTASDAVERARSGKGPTFIECMTYRWRGHVGPNWDRDIGIRSHEEVDWWLDNCPVKKTEKYLLDNEMLTMNEKETEVASILSEIEEALSYAERSPYPDLNGNNNRVFRQ